MTRCRFDNYGGGVISALAVHEGEGDEVYIGIFDSENQYGSWDFLWKNFPVGMIRYRLEMLMKATIPEEYRSQVKWIRKDCPDDLIAKRLILGGLAEDEILEQVTGTLGWKYNPIKES